MNSRCKLFFDNTSIRGVSKLSKAHWTFLKVLWLSFVVCMSFVLVVGSVHLLVKFFMYETNVQTNIELNHVTEFPSVTLCSHRPFSNRAFKAWKSGQVESPRHFSEKLRQVMLKVMEHQHYDMARELFYSDRVETYIQSLSNENMKLISTTAEDFFVYCVIEYDGKTTIGHINDCGVKIIHQYDPVYVSCFTVTLDPHLSNKTTNLAFVLSIDRGERNSDDLEHGFVLNAFRQTRGVRVALHERGTLPDVVRKGFNVIPGAYSEVSYSVHHWTEENTPTDPCFEDNNIKHVTFHDQTKSYRYSQEACFSAFIGMHVLEQCKCVSAWHISPLNKSSNTPYCESIDFENPHENVERRKCLHNVVANKTLNDLKSLKCRRPCVYVNYPSEASTSHWMPSSWQMYWSKRISDKWRILESPNASEADRFSAKYEIYNYLNATNLTVVLNDKFEDLTVGDYLVVSLLRSGFDVLKYSETYQITISALVSQLGGMCSLTLGLTCAVLAEILEWIFLSFNSQKNPHEIDIPLDMRIDTFTDKNLNGRPLSEISEEMQQLQSQNQG